MSFFSHFKLFSATVLSLVALSGACMAQNSTPQDSLASPQPSGIAIFGNSISTYPGSVPSGYAVFYNEYLLPSVNDTWWMILSNLMQEPVVANASWSGSTVTTCPRHRDASFFTADSRINALRGEHDPKYIFIAGGTNDWAVAQFPLGSYDANQPTDSTNFSGAYALMLSKLTDRYPNSQLVCLSIFPRLAGTERANRAGWTISEQNEAIEHIANAFGAWFIHLGDCGMTQKNIMDFTFDGLHPNAQGMRRIANTLWDKLKPMINKQ